jgi:penicillin-binding protein 1C
MYSCVDRGQDVDGRDKPGHDVRRGWWLIRKAVAAATVVVVLTGAATAAWVASLGPLPLDQARKISTTVIDRNGKLLRAYAMTDGRWRLPVDAKTFVDPGYLNILLGYEDKRFYSHHGVDPLALGRAALQLVTRGEIVSGGSTITMQLARLIEPRQQRSISAKIRQAVRALQIERQMSKDQILDLYLALAPFGGNLEGLRAASIAYFGKEPKRLSLAESALLVALPQSPEHRRLDRHPGNARVARDRVLERMVGEGRVSAADAMQAKSVSVPKLRKPMPILAPHSADQATSLHKDRPIIKLALDAGYPACA